MIILFFGKREIGERKKRKERKRKTSGVEIRIENESQPAEQQN